MVRDDELDRLLLIMNLWRRALRHNLQMLDEAWTTLWPVWNSGEPSLDAWRSWLSAYIAYLRTKEGLANARTQVNERKKQLKSQARDLAVRTRVPDGYIRHLKVVWKRSGEAHLYFGGKETPDGPGHGHYIVTPSGRLRYRREPDPAYVT